jgi:oxygen-independent coproporphyrinogen-3 oxidase
MAEFGYRLLTSAGYVAIGFDHFALPGDPMAKALAEKRLHRNFQGFTDDAAQSLIGLGASAISCFPELLVQNEKNAGRYRMLLSQDILPAVGGIARSADDRRRGEVITQLLCHGEARIDADLAREVAGRIAPFTQRGLADFDGVRLAIQPDGRPYARTIAALFDPYRQDSVRRFSSAV